MFLIAVILALPARAAVAQSDDSEWLEAEQRLAELMISQPPRGFVLNPDFSGPIGRDLVDNMAVGYSQAFDSTGETPAFLTLVLWDAGPGVGSAEFWFAALTAPDESVAPFDAGFVHPDAYGTSASSSVDGQNWAVHSVYLRHGGLVVQGVHEAPADVAPDVVRDRLRSLVDSQLARPSVPETPIAVPAEAAYLKELMLQDPGRAPGGRDLYLLPNTSGLFSPELGAQLGFDDSRLDHMRDMTTFARGYMQHWADPVGGVDLVIQLHDVGEGPEAAGFIDGARSRMMSRSDFELVDHDDEVLAVASTRPVDGVWVAMLFARQGPIFYVVSASGLRDRDELLEFAERVLDEQRKRLRPGDTDLPSSETVTWPTAFGAAIGTAVALLVLPRLIGKRLALRRTKVRFPQPLPTRAQSTVERARRLRGNGVVLGAGLIFAFGLVLMGLVPYFWPAGFIAAGVGLVAAPSLLALVRYHGARAQRIGLRRPRLVRSAVIGTAGLAAAVLGVVALSVYVVLGLTEPSLSLRDLEREVGLTADALNSIVLVVAISMLLLSAFMLRAARRQARLRAAEVRRLDSRRPVLYLRGFADDKLRIPAIVSGRRTAIELFLPTARDNFEAVVAWELDATGPPVAIAPPGARLASMGAAREYAPDPDQWHEYVWAEIDEASLVVVSLGRTQGLLWELAAIRARNAQERTILIFPPVGDDELRTRWEVARTSLVPEGMDLELPLDPAEVLVALIEDGMAVAITADQRDEAGYRAAIIVALKHFGV